jgi:hypothetical protein
MLSSRVRSPFETALCEAVKAYLALHHGHVRLPALYEVFRTWGPSVTPDLLDSIVHEAITSGSRKEAPQVPSWDARSGRLYFAGRLVKEFKRPAPNQRRLLNEFEHAHWQTEIHNPFLQDRVHSAAAVEALRNTAEALNDDHLTAGLIRFGTRDNCAYIYWKAVGERPQRRVPK